MSEPCQRRQTWPSPAVAASGRGQLHLHSLGTLPPSAECGTAWRDFCTGGLGLVNALTLAPGHLWPYKAGREAGGGSHLAQLHGNKEGQKPQG